MQNYDFSTISVDIAMGKFKWKTNTTDNTV